MITVHVKNFGNGIAKDYTDVGVGECAISKHFDTVNFPNRLQPFRAMTSSGEPTTTLLGGMILASNGSMYGVGTQSADPTKAELYKRTGYGGSDFWQRFTAPQTSSAIITESAGHYAFSVYYPQATGARKLFWSATNTILFSDPDDAGGSLDSGALTFSTIGQGIVHPNNKKLYFPYQNSGTFIARHDGSAGAPFSPSGTLNASAWNTSVLTLPSQYRAYCLSYYGDYLAIPLTTATIGVIDKSIVALWDITDETQTTFTSIPWGSEKLKVLNNLGGQLVGISEIAGNSSQFSQDMDGISIKAWAGGSEPTEIMKILVKRLTTTVPSAVLHERVNYIQNGRLYFSMDLVGGGENYYGLWSVGKNDSGRWTVVLERMATNTGTDTGVIACAAAGDFVTMVHTSNGTISTTVNGNSLSNIFGATSVLNSGINPGMSQSDKGKRKQVVGIYCDYLPLPADATIVFQYRVDTGLDGAWTTIFTETTDSATRTERIYDTNGNKFTIGVNYEFRITSTNGGVVTVYGYKYQVLGTNI